MAHHRNARKLPLARRDPSLLVERLNDELLIFDTTTQQGHCLNATAALVWERCDGATSFDGLADELERSGQTRGRPLVEQALAQLGAADLLVHQPSGSSRRRELSRRRALVAVGAAAGAVLVQSLVAPPAWAACSPRNAPCTVGATCCSHACNPGTGLCL